jgi:single-strand DNA-binding protein
VSSITIEGNLVRDPELKFLNSGAANVKLSVGVNQGYKNKQGEWVDKASFFDVEAFGPLAENVANCLRKGDRIMVTGALEQQSWETPEGKRYKIVVKAHDIAASVKTATVVITRADKTNRAEVEEAF